MCLRKVRWSSHIKMCKLLIAKILTIITCLREGCSKNLSTSKADLLQEKQEVPVSKSMGGGSHFLGSRELTRNFYGFWAELARDVSGTRPSISM